MQCKFLVAAAFLMAVVIGNTNAQVVRNGKTQHQRIKQGVKSGELTRAEAINLRKGQKDVRQDVKAAKADGEVTREEKNEIRQDRKVESRKIAIKKHNSRVKE
jgi:methylthioribose-1-phosphate isomerase